jgi:hypothetical protein
MNSPLKYNCLIPFSLFFVVLSFLSTITLKAQDCKVLDPNLSGVYTGDCKSGKASGQGKSVGKYTYEGEFKAGLPEGKGQLTDDLGNVFNGNFKKGKKNGEGIANFKTAQGKDSIVNGFWKNDAYVGRYENPYTLVKKTFNVGAVSISYEDPTPPNSSIVLSLENISEGGGLKGILPKPVLADILIIKGSYQVMNVVTTNPKKNIYTLQNIGFPATLLFKINNEELQIDFNEAKNYKLIIPIRD